MEIINTGDLKRIKYENTEDVAATRIFQGIYGVGTQLIVCLTGWGRSLYIQVAILPLLGSRAG